MFPHQISILPIRATYTANLILFDLITRNKLGEQYRSLSECDIYLHLSKGLASGWQETVLCNCIYSPFIGV